MSWWVWYNVQSGQPAQVIQEPSAAAVQAKTGFPPLAGPFTTRAAAQHWITTSPQGQATTPRTAGSIASGLATGWVNDIFTGGGKLNMFVRIGEVGLGLVLVAVGVAKMTSAVPAATRIAKAVGTKGLA